MLGVPEVVVAETEPMVAIAVVLGSLNERWKVLASPGRKLSLRIEEEEAVPVMVKEGMPEVMMPVPVGV